MFHTETEKLKTDIKEGLKNLYLKSLPCSNSNAIAKFKSTKPITTQVLWNFSFLHKYSVFLFYHLDQNFCFNTLLGSDGN